MEWISAKQFLAADVNGIIALDTMEESQFTSLDFDFDLPLDVPEHQFRGHEGGVYQVLKHPRRDKVFASCSVDRTVRVWSLNSATAKHTLEGHFGYVTEIAWVSNDSDLLVSAAFDGAVRLWNSKTGDCVYAMEAHRDRVTNISISSDGCYVASAGHDGNVNFWSLDSGKLINTYEGPGRMLRVEFNEYGNLLAATSYGVAEVLKLKYNGQAH